MVNIEKPLSFVSGGRFISDGEWIHNRRIIDNYEIIVGLTGTVYIQQGEKKYEVNPGDVLILLPRMVHRGYKKTAEPCSFFWLHFFCRGQYNILPDEEAFTYILFADPHYHFNKMSKSILVPVKFTPGNKERLLIQFRQLLDVTANKYYTSYSSDYLLTSLLIELSQQAIKDAYNTPDILEDRNERLSSILEWIRIHIEKNITVKEISEKFNYNSDHLSRLFKKHLGVSTIKYINGMKILKAKELLSLTEKKIKEISYLLGFKDEKYFMKLFKKYENITPSEYRRAYYKTHMNNQ